MATIIIEGVRTGQYAEIKAILGVHHMRQGLGPRWYAHFVTKEEAEDAAYQINKFPGVKAEVFGDAD